MLHIFSIPYLATQGEYNFSLWDAGSIPDFMIL